MAKTKRREHPVQPLVRDSDGVVRFKLSYVINRAYEKAAEQPVPRRKAKKRA